MYLDQIEKEVREILIREIDGSFFEHQADNSQIMDILGDDVLELVKALMVIEEKFKIEFESDTIVDSISIESIINYIERHQNQLAYRSKIS